MLSTGVTIAAVSYLIGSIPFGYILVRIFRGQDIRASGSGNIGATNVARTAPGLGLATLLLDAMKGVAAVFIATHLLTTDDYLGSPLPLFNEANTYLAVAALFSVLGHMFPMWLKFRGGKGVATAVGALAVLAPGAMLVSLAIFLLVVGVTRYVSLGSILGALVFPIAMRILNPQIPWPAIAITGGISILILLKHHENIRRLLAGTENRFALKKKAAAVQLANED
jgi:acyl phosphate:glycerol-3-phosphate acyltransferase